MNGPRKGDAGNVHHKREDRDHRPSHENDRIIRIFLPGNVRCTQRCADFELMGTFFLAAPCCVTWMRRRSRQRVAGREKPALEDNPWCISGCEDW